METDGRMAVVVLHPPAPILVLAALPTAEGCSP